VTVPVAAVECKLGVTEFCTTGTGPSGVALRGSPASALTCLCTEAHMPLKSLPPVVELTQRSPPSLSTSLNDPRLTRSLRLTRVRHWCNFATIPPLSKCREQKHEHQQKACTSDCSEDHSSA
jgi:hypothetical protein